jgi:hypothetical protein
MFVVREFKKTFWIGKKNLSNGSKRHSSAAFHKLNTGHYAHTRH